MKIKGLVSDFKKDFVGVVESMAMDRAEELHYVSKIIFNKIGVLIDKAKKNQDMQERDEEYLHMDFKVLVNRLIKDNTGAKIIINKKVVDTNFSSDEKSLLEQSLIVRGKNILRDEEPGVSFFHKAFMLKRNKLWSNKENKIETITPSDLFVEINTNNIMADIVIKSATFLARNNDFNAVFTSVDMSGKISDVFSSGVYLQAINSARMKGDNKGDIVLNKIQSTLESASEKINSDFINNKKKDDRKTPSKKRKNNI